MLAAVLLGTLVVSIWPINFRLAATEIAIGRDVGMLFLPGDQNGRAFRRWVRKSNLGAVEVYAVGLVGPHHIGIAIMTRYE
jgi:hypothetical protein